MRKIFPREFLRQLRPFYDSDLIKVITRSTIGLMERDWPYGHAIWSFAICIVRRSFLAAMQNLQTPNQEPISRYLLLLRRREAIAFYPFKSPSSESNRKHLFAELQEGYLNKSWNLVVLLCGF